MSLKCTGVILVDRGRFEPLPQWRYHPKTQSLVGFRFAVIYLNMKETHLQIKVAFEDEHSVFSNMRFFVESS